MCFRVILNVTKSDSQTKAPNCFLFSLTFLNGPGVYHSESNKVLKPSVLLKVQMLDFLLLCWLQGCNGYLYTCWELQTVLQGGRLEGARL